MASHPFTDPEAKAIRDAYEALTRVGNLTAVRGTYELDRTVDGWDGIIDRAHHDLGLLLLKFRIDQDPD